MRLFTVNNAYIRSGLALIVAGILVLLSSALIFQITWLTALGICLLILSFILIALGRSVPELPPEACALLMETGMGNTAALIEELGIRTKAIYLPSSLTSDRPQALVPLHDQPSWPSIRSLPRRLVVKYGSQPDDIGLLITTAGSAAVAMLEARPAPTPVALESSLTALFSGRLGVADSTSVSCQNNHLSVEIHRPRLASETGWSQHCLGGPLASIAAALAAEAWDRPVTILREDSLPGMQRVELEIIGS